MKSSHTKNTLMNTAKVISETKAFKRLFLSQTPMHMAFIKLERFLHNPDCKIGKCISIGKSRLRCAFVNR